MLTYVERASFDRANGDKEFREKSDHKTEDDEFGKVFVHSTGDQEFGKTFDHKTEDDEFGEDFGQTTGDEEFGKKFDQATEDDEFGEDFVRPTEDDEFGEKFDHTTEGTKSGENFDRSTKDEEFGEKLDHKTGDKELKKIAALLQRAASYGDDVRESVARMTTCLVEDGTGETEDEELLLKFGRIMKMTLLGVMPDEEEEVICMAIMGQFSIEELSYIRHGKVSYDNHSYMLGVARKIIKLLQHGSQDLAGRAHRRVRLRAV